MAVVDIVIDDLKVEQQQTVKSSSRRMRELFGGLAQPRYDRSQPLRFASSDYVTAPMIFRPDHVYRIPI